ncbi:MAG: DUF5671 domain-containing protein [Bryobacterales bacterium]|jgi:hypothetical protein|nr:DUF5671 domain-containing protein [Bryobacterales bacterium]
MPDLTNRTQLREFVLAAKQQGASDEFLAALLIRQGWLADDVYQSIGSYWEGVTGMPVPRRGPAAESSREAFLYLLSFLALAVWTTALGTILFQLVNVWVPDAVSGGYYPSVRSIITWSMAAMAVAYPLYVLVTRVLMRESAANPDRLQSGVRKWLTYLALLLTAGTVLGDLIGFTGYFLLGELSMRYVLKSLIVLLICGGIFVFYMSSLPGGGSGWRMFGTAQRRLLGWAATVSVVSVFVAGLLVAGMPADQRRLQADQRRVEDLRRIAQEIQQWGNQAEVEAKAAGESTDGSTPEKASKLPESLEFLRDQSGVSRIADPETGIGYEYKILTPETYRLCATFALPNPRDEYDGGRRMYAYGNHGQFWKHPAGPHCFVFDSEKAVPW